jgi:hypothetical protein
MRSGVRSSRGQVPSTPPVESVTIGRTVAGDPGSYLQLFASANLLDRPQSHETISIRIDSPMPNPWTEEPLLRYYPEDNIVQLSPGSFVQLEPDLAADVEAARELGADGSRRSVGSCRRCGRDAD